MPIIRPAAPGGPTRHQHRLLGDPCGQYDGAAGLRPVCAAHGNCRREICNGLDGAGQAAARGVSGAARAECACYPLRAGCGMQRGPDKIRAHAVRLCIPPFQQQASTPSQQTPPARRPRSPHHHLLGGVTRAQVQCDRLGFVRGPLQPPAGGAQLPAASAAGPWTVLRTAGPLMMMLQPLVVAQGPSDPPAGRPAGGGGRGPASPMLWRLQPRAWHRQGDHRFKHHRGKALVGRGTCWQPQAPPLPPPGGWCHCAGAGSVD
jgi:hypothetical protein